jgi:NADH-quinone oxidoreductase subunit N
MTLDHVALLPVYVAAGAVVLVFLTDLIAPGRRSGVLAVAALGAAATGLTAYLVGRSGLPRTSFCDTPKGLDETFAAPVCSYVFDNRAALLAVLFAALTLGVLALSGPALRSGSVPAGEYCFLLIASMAGGVVLGAARDLITLIVALETLTLPLYILVGLRRRSLASGQAAVTFFLVSVISTAVALLGAALLFAATGAVQFTRLQHPGAIPDQARPLATAGVALLLIGLSFKVAAVPLHAWAPPTYDGAPLPIAAYLSTASKLGGVTALLAVVGGALGPWSGTAGLVLAVLATLTMSVGNLVALRQRRMVRLLAWSSVAQAGYIIAPLGALALVDEPRRQVVDFALGATLAYAVFYVLLELGAFGAVVALRGPADGGEIVEYRGVMRRAPWIAGAMGLALAGLAGLPPGLAGLFAKVVVVRSLLEGGAGWLAIVVALNAVVGLAYYVRVAATLFSATEGVGPAEQAARTPGEPATRAPLVPAGRSWAVGAALAIVTVAAVVVGLAPQLVIAAATP